MKNTAVIALERFEDNAKAIAELLGAEYHPYQNDIFDWCFSKYSRIVALMSAGIALRKIAPLLKDKWVDPAVVVVSPDLRYAIPIIGGHHGGNLLAKELGPLGIIPVITTATENFNRTSVEAIARDNGCDVVNRDSTRMVNAAILDGEIPVYTINGPGIVIAGPGVSFLVKNGKYIVGIGCRKGVGPEEVKTAVIAALNSIQTSLDEVFVFATTRKKMGEQGLIDCVANLGGNLVFLDDETINNQPVNMPSRAGLIGLQGVAEPAALALSKHRELLLKKQVYGRITIAIAK